MFYIESLARIRTVLRPALSIVAILISLFFLAPNRTLAQDANGGGSIEAISRRLEELEKQIEGLKRENAELRKKFEQNQAPKEALAVQKETPAVEAPAPAQEETKPNGSRFEFGGEIRLRPQIRGRNADVFFDDVDSFIGQRVRLHVKAKLTDDISGFVELQDSRVWGAEFSTNASIRGVDLHQAYIQADRFLTPDLSLRIGRQELSYGDERLIGAFDWDFVGRSFDAIKAVYAKKSWSADIFAARIADLHGTFANVTEGSDGFTLPNRDFYGAYLKFFNDRPNQKLEVYGLISRDDFADLGEIGRHTDSTSVYTVGTRGEMKSDGGLYAGGEVAFQTGHLGPDDHRALALASRAGKYFKSGRSPHFGFEYDFATGDGNSRDGRSREFIDLFPNNHIHYGYIDFMGWRNMHDFRANFGFDPASRLSFDADYHKFYLHNARGRWSSASGSTLGFDPSGDSGKDIGQEVDLTLRFPYKEHMKFLAGYSFFLPGRFAKLTRTSDISHFSYIQTLIRF